MAQTVNSLPAVQEIRVQSLCMATHSSILTWRILWTEEPGVKNSPAMQVTQVRSLGWEDPLEKGMGTHSNILTWRIPWTEEPEGLQSLRSQRVGLN